MNKKIIVLPEKFYTIVENPSDAAKISMVYPDLTYVSPDMLLALARLDENVGKIAIFKYTKSCGTSSNRTIRVVSEDYRYLVGQDYHDEGMIKKFIKENIYDIQFVEDYLMKQKPANK